MEYDRRHLERTMTITRTSRALAASVALTAIAITGCSSDSKSAATTAAPAATTAAPADTSAPDASTATTGGSADAGAASMTIKGFKFSAVTAVAGEAITVTNEDTAAHTVTDDGGTFSVDVPAGGTATLTVPAAGTYEIHCNIHSSMKGSITIG
jgi:plastocyanin